MYDETVQLESMNRGMDFPKSLEYSSKFKNSRFDHSLLKKIDQHLDIFVIIIN